METALEGRLPILPDERLFVSARTFLSSCVVFGAAIWVFMIGASLSAIGDVRFAVGGYMAGLIIGFVPVLLSIGIPCFRYGIDTMDVIKSSFGQRGHVFPVLGLIYCSLAWCSVVAALIAQGTLTLWTANTGNVAPVWCEPVMALVVVVLAWLLMRHGPQMLEKVNNVIAPALLIIAVTALALLMLRYGWGAIWSDHMPSTGWQFHDRHMTVTQGFEQGMGISFGSWPFIGGLTRLVARRKHIVTPSMVGANVIGLGFGSIMAALVANTLVSNDPVVWFLQLGGLRLGTAIALVVLFSNIAVIALFIYFAAVAAQQVEAVRRLHWEVIPAALLVPVGIFACFPHAVLTSVPTINSYQGMVFVGICGVSTVHYLAIDRQVICLRSIFAAPGEGNYAYFGGFNLRALVAALVGSGIFRLLINPTNLEPGPGFMLFGASLPALAGSMLLYALLCRLSPPKTGIDAAVMPQF